ncbi:FG-GAP-like repeat-containing protein [Nocardioides daeguensis]|uniref:DUF2510 domain-containing protein n=1 Tax=Nocardioides daeguensis TaxID=908359 RepID=A0ABP6VCL7_9ACTN|nr:FG-GAP-like repeat-containing protein [Nocardioides daeguensis]MBV6729384.1 VCBS repeat-containing protein [Nocardioides daeguensis]MCR1771843.1 VCBS repeat-containing protein [Nocardioides daeguensis]
MSNITPPGWYPDGDGMERRWDGAEWTDERRPMTRFAPVDESTRVRPAAAVPAAPSLPPPPAFAPPPVPPVPPIPPVPPTSPPAFAPAPPRQRRLGPWIALAVVLVLLAATAGTLAALRPWADRTTATGGGGEGHPVAVQGDLDGNGYGDAVYYFSPDYDRTSRVTASSNGTVFTTSERALEDAVVPDELSLDWDDDGVDEQLGWVFDDEADQLRLSSSDPEFPGDQTFRLPMSALDGGGTTILVQAGDFDGDGTADLAVAGPNDRTVEIDVLAGDGTGGFADPVRWASLTNATIDATEIRSGDFDHDGDADLWTRLPAERVKDEDRSGYYSGERGYALLTSTGTEFEVGAVVEDDLYADAYLVGDVTGDGTTSLVAVQVSAYTEEIEVRVYDLADGRPRAVAGFTGTSTVGQRSLQGAALSDVDGDGDGDVVFVVKALRESKFTGVQVMTSTGAVFERATVWAETPACDDADCRIEFPGS